MIANRLIINQSVTSVISFSKRIKKTVQNISKNSFSFIAILRLFIFRRIFYTYILLKYSIAFFFIWKKKLNKRKCTRIKFSPTCLGNPFSSLNRITRVMRSQHWHRIPFEKTCMFFLISLVWVYFSNKIWLRCRRTEAHAKVQLCRFSVKQFKFDFKSSFFTKMKIS